MKRIILIIAIMLFSSGCVREVGENWIVVLIPVEVTTTTTTVMDLYVPQMELYEWQKGHYNSTLDNNED